MISLVPVVVDNSDDATDDDAVREEVGLNFLILVELRGGFVADPERLPSFSAIAT